MVDNSPGNVGVDSSLTTVHATVLYFVNTLYVLTPYLAAGIGLGKYSVDVGATSFIRLRSASIWAPA